ncbi:T9SS type B sorting domain-containing protein [Tamlana fucoidanivorans]|uniref:T9SS type B sorting domain-containing protein n=1 Tax=Allotamlana fucoidanivorans TaxID=2583814 RepID=A0A5C4SHV4_9FLAO|nr:T9SS type B sorting domain-containing protein [Tamlana fucoidanivorans]TNJ43191.1 T9SS type B sorting domain-containing protein [Tamlana fucoidanivorans]
MQTPHHIKPLLFVFYLLIGNFVFAQLSKTHYIPPLTSGPDNAIPQDQYIYISTPNSSLVPYTITEVGGATITGSVSNTAPQVEIVSLTGGDNTQLFIPRGSTSTVYSNKGYIIEAEAPIYVSVRMNAGGAQAGALVSKGISALDKTFRIGAFTNQAGRIINNNGTPSENLLSFLSVMATEDLTTVHFSGISNNTEVENFNRTFPYEIVLNKGESYCIAMNSYSAVHPTNNKVGLIGSLITSDKPIAVNCGSANGSFHNGGGRDYGIDQIAGLSKVGKEYIFVRGNGNDSWENVLVVAHYDNTSITINGAANPVTTLNAGEHYVIEGNYYINGNMYVETSEDTFMYQGVGGLNTNGQPSEANQGMFFVPPLSCETRGNIDNIASIDKIGNLTYNGGISIVTKTGANVTVNNQALSNFSTIGPSSVIGNTDYVTYKVTGLTGNVSVQGDDELYVAYFNQNGAATSGSFYSGFQSKPEFNFDVQHAILGNCIGNNLTLSVANALNFESFEWQFDDGSGYIILPITDSFITPTLPGKYKLVGELPCNGGFLESIEVPVSICPDDNDNDGIIDNLDIDNDNDGILNCTESRGDVTINLNNLNNPILEFQDTTTNSSITSGIYATSSSSNGSNTFVGNNLGNFTSKVEAAASAEGNYSMTFTEPVNVKLSEDTSYTHSSVDGEYFVVKIFPANKNITLVDPDDRLLVDSNFDGLFETGITQISGSEIHFKHNPAATGSTPFEIFANQVNGLEFIHRLSNLSNSSNFQANISLTCFKKDSDLDGVPDSLDLDSDNDGIPDSIENQGLLITLSDTDADLNGLDDIFDINITPVDSDNDGIPDYLDLDSDNDGITDLIETGQLGNFSDTDLNGVVDGPDFGSNGWIDTAETSPDSNLIGYTLDDTDADGIFSYRDADADGDSCSDVIEAGFSDVNGDDFLGDNIPTVDANGLVNNANGDGYTIPNADYLNFAPLAITTQPINTPICLLDAGQIFVESIEAELFQWEVSTDGINWSVISDDAIYSGTQTNTLSFSNAPANFNNNVYRVKLDRAGNSCGLYSDEVILTIYDLPLVSTPSTYKQCDDASNDGQAFFNLTLDNIKTEINPNYGAESLVFTYFETQLDAEMGTNAITSPEAYQDAVGFSNETVWIRVENSNGCHQEVSLELQVNPSGTALTNYTPNTYYECDDGTDVRDGISSFDFSDMRTHINDVLFPSLNVSVHFFESQLDAELETNEIPDISAHQNSNSPNRQDIWVRVKSDLDNDCLGLEVFPDLLIVEALPVANPVTIARQCDYDLSDTVLSYPFDTSQIESTILGNQNPANVSITYFDEQGNTLSSPLPNPFITESQTISIVVTNNISNDSDGACFDQTSLEFIVDAQPVANPILPIEVCDGALGDIDNDGYSSFDTSSFTNTILGNQSGMEIYYDYIDENGGQIVDATALPNPIISATQTIQVRVINPINPMCYANTNIEIIVNPLPNFTVETPQIVCSSDPTFSIILDPIEANITETFNYEWYWTSLDGSTVNQFVSNQSTITVSTPGTYTVTLTKTDGTGCSRSETIFVDASELATITQDDVTIEDIKENNSVSIDPTHLGRGDYEYALQLENSNFINYQEEPYFENVRPGFHTIHVRDKICGTASLKISVIGYDKFFTPNGDGFNDTWKIKGVNAAFQPNTTVLIFDRYGKLLKQLSVASDGWDGTLNGYRLPTDDYWFRVVLEDGRTFSGHFTLKR